MSNQCTQACKMLWLSAGFGLRSPTVRASKGVDVLARLPSPTSSRSASRKEFPTLMLKLKDRAALEAMQIGSLRCIDTIIRSRRRSLGRCAESVIIDNDANIILFFYIQLFLSAPTDNVNDWILKRLTQPFELFEERKHEKPEAPIWERLTRRSKSCLLDTICTWLSSVAHDSAVLRRSVAHLTNKSHEGNDEVILGKRSRKSTQERRTVDQTKVPGRDDAMSDLRFLSAFLQNTSYVVEILPNMADIEVSAIRRHLLEIEVHVSALSDQSSLPKKKISKLSKDDPIASVLSLIERHSPALLSALGTALGTLDPGQENAIDNERTEEDDDDDASSVEVRVRKSKRRRRQRRLHSRNAVVNAWLAEEDGGEEDMYADLEDFLVA